MRLPLLPVLAVLLIGILLDLYIWKALHNRLHRRTAARIQAVSAAVFNLALLVAVCMPRRSGSDSMLLADMWLIFGYSTIYIPKLLWTLFDLLASVPRLFGRHRLKWLSASGTVVGAALFVIFWWGALVTRLDIDVDHVEVSIPGLPEAFDGYRILQFSDLHTGTFGHDTSFVSELVDSIQSQKPDLILFTGDIVNRRSDELEPFVSALSRLNAPDGVISILGNHDYGDYSAWPSPQAKADNMQLLYRLQRDMGWTLLRDANVSIARGGDSIIVVGVENIGERPFPVYGSLRRAEAGVPDSLIKILLTHNPRHWADSVANRRNVNIALTLSGHTHAMQMMIGGWSPAKYRYPQWSGLYTDSLDRKLYVNIGSGAVGFPARLLQATPRLTVITLRKHTPTTNN